MKSAVVGFILLMGLNSFAGTNSVTNEGVAWDINLTPEGFISEVFNSTDINKMCSISYLASVLDETGLVKGFKKVSYSNYILMGRQSYRFEILKQNYPQPESFTFGEIKVEEALKCEPFYNTSLMAIKAMEGALRNSDVESAALFRRYALNPDNGWHNPYMSNAADLKILNVSNSLFNSQDAEATLELNHLETEKTTQTLNEARGTTQVCKERKSIKCGYVFYTKGSPACGVAEYNTLAHAACGCEESTRIAGTRVCLKYKTCTLEKFGAKSYNECAHPAHGVSDVLSCPLKLSVSGAFEACQL